MADTFRLDLTEEPKVISGSRVFDAPRSLVFEAWTDPKHLANWWGPNGFSLTTHTFDFRAGGVWRFIMHGPDGRDYQNRITFDEIVPPERIAYHHGGGDDVEPVQFRTLVTFEDVRGKTRLTMRATFPSAGARDRVIREYGADKGLVQTLARLADYLAQTDEFVVERVFEAPRKLVWQAWTEPERLAQWWGPKGAAIRVAKHELRPGGIFHYAMQLQPGRDIWGRFIYREIAAPDRLVFVSSFSDADGGITRPPFRQLGDDWPLEILNTLALVEQGGQTTLTLRGCPINATEEGRKAYASMIGSMQQIYAGTFDKLAEHLAGSKGAL
jgi:uncharacterized protein YndB with AHSA1/START domain